jgi:hypothetical protein
MPTPIATGTLTLSTAPPHERLCRTPSTDAYGHGRDSGRPRHAPTSLQTFLNLSDKIRDGIRSPHKAWPMPSTRRVDTPARYMSTSASPTLPSRRRQRSITTDPKTIPPEFRHPHRHFPGPDRQITLAVARTVRLPGIRTPVSRRSRQLVRLGVQHRIQRLIDLLGRHPVEFGLEHGLVDLHDFPGHGPASCLPIAVFLFGD